jgi:hypothetical protein
MYFIAKYRKQIHGIIGAIALKNIPIVQMIVTKAN